MNGKLFAVNQLYLGQEDVDVRWKAWGLLPHYRDAGKAGSRIAVCMANAAELIILVLFFAGARGIGASAPRRNSAGDGQVSGD